MTALREPLDDVHVRPAVLTGEIALEDRLVRRDMARRAEGRARRARIGLHDVDHQEGPAVGEEPLYHLGTEEDRALNRRTSLKVILTDTLEEKG